MSKLLKLAQNQHAAALAGMQRLAKKLEDEGRNAFTEAEEAEFRKLQNEDKRASEIIGRESQKLEEQRTMPAVTDRNALTYEDFAELYGEDAAKKNFASSQPKIVHDAAGNEVKLLGPQHSMFGTLLGIPVKQSNLSIGKLIRGAATGIWTGAESERLAMAEGANSTGGVLVPDALWGSLLDAARAQSAYVRAGARTVVMDSETLMMPRIDSDPTFSIKGENQAWSETEIGFGGVQMVAKTFGCIIRVSNELMQDGGDLASKAIEMSLTRGLAASIDSAALIGSNGGFEGIINNPTIVAAQTGSVGAIDWLDLHTAALAVRANNFEPSGYIADPEIAGDLDALTSGDGTNSARLWLGPPPSITDVRRYTTTAMPTSKIIMGDFSYAVVGVRMKPLIEFSRVADTAMQKYQTLVRIAWRGDFAVLRTTAFHLLAGITT